MEKIAKGSLLVASAAFLFLAGPFQPQPSLRAQEQNVQVIELTAKKYEFSPAPVHVKAGTKVQLKITAVDHDHGFKIATVPEGAASGSKPGLIFASPQDCFQLKKKETTTIEFVAQTPGTYPFRCCHVCGFGHKGMHSELIVE
ncbi:MAG TPA: multicopper oxidase domain-containing protein [Candidatus Acidoferrum sp.]